MSTDTLTTPDRPQDRTRPGLICRQCRAQLAPAAQPGGAFVNPIGHVHDIVITPRAPGVAAVGPVTTAFTWFPGYGWQVAFCRQCGSHVGWCYLATGEQQPDLFFGLRRDALGAP